MQLRNNFNHHNKSCFFSWEEKIDISAIINAARGWQFPILEYTPKCLSVGKVTFKRIMVHLDLVTNWYPFHCYPFQYSLSSPNHKYPGSITHAVLANDYTSPPTTNTQKKLKYHSFSCLKLHKTLICIFCHLYFVFFKHKGKNYSLVFSPKLTPNKTQII